MKCNVGTIDRVTRGLLGIIVGSGGLMLQDPIFRWPMLSVSAAFLITSIFAWCPMYYAVGRSTRTETAA